MMTSRLLLEHRGATAFGQGKIHNQGSHSVEGALLPQRDAEGVKIALQFATGCSKDCRLR